MSPTHPSPGPPSMNPAPGTPQCRARSGGRILGLRSGRFGALNPGRKGGPKPEEMTVACAFKVLKEAPPVISVIFYVFTKKPIKTAKNRDDSFFPNFAVFERFPSVKRKNRDFYGNLLKGTPKKRPVISFVISILGLFGAPKRGPFDR